MIRQEHKGIDPKGPTSTKFPDRLPKSIPRLPFTKPGLPAIRDDGEEARRARRVRSPVIRHRLSTKVPQLRASTRSLLTLHTPRLVPCPERWDWWVPDPPYKNSRYARSTPTRRPSGLSGPTASSAGACRPPVLDGSSPAGWLPLTGKCRRPAGRCENPPIELCRWNNSSGGFAWLPVRIHFPPE